MVAIADPNEERAQEILQSKRQGPHADLYRECEVFSSYQDALGKGNIDIAFIGQFESTIIDLRDLISVVSYHL